MHPWTEESSIQFKDKLKERIAICHRKASIKVPSLDKYATKYTANPGGLYISITTALYFLLKTKLSNLNWVIHYTIMDHVDLKKKKN
jgi:hypothetical protein